MNISSLPINRINKFVFNKVQSKSFSVAQNPISQNVDFAKPTSQNYQAYALTNLSFCALKEVDKYRKFANVDEFAEYFESKLKAELKVKDEKDIINSIDKISQVTGASKELATEVLTRVTQFSSYSQIAELDNQLYKDDYFIRSCLPIKCNVNNQIHYVGATKGFFKKRNIVNEIKNTFVIDNTVLKELPKIKNSAPYYYCNAKAREGDIEFAIIDGWNTLIDNKEMSYSLFGMTDNYENISIAVIDEMKKTGKSLDEVLNGDSIKKIKDFFGESALIRVVQNSNVKEPSVKTILDNINPIIPNKNQIKAAIDVVTEIVATERFYMKKHTANYKKAIILAYIDSLFSPETQDEVDEELAKKMQDILFAYLDNTFLPYSVETINDELKEKYSILEDWVNDNGYSMEDVYYLIPSEYKSFDLMTYQYAKANNIPNDKIVAWDGQHKKPEVLNGKIVVMLDDCICSGDSVVKQQFSYLDAFYYNPQKLDCKLIFAPIVLMQSGKDIIGSYTQRAKRENDDFYMPSKLIDFDRDVANSISKEDIEKYLNEVVGHSGYHNQYGAISFPFNIPDNDTDFSTLFSSMFLPEYVHNCFYGKIDSNWVYPVKRETCLNRIKYKLEQSMGEQN